MPISQRPLSFVQSNIEGLMKIYKVCGSNSATKGKFSRELAHIIERAGKAMLASKD